MNLQISTLFAPGDKCVVIHQNCLQDAKVVSITLSIHASHPPHQPHIERGYCVQFNSDGECENIRERQIAATKEDILKKLSEGHL